MRGGLTKRGMEEVFGLTELYCGIGSMIIYVCQNLQYYIPPKDKFFCV